MRSPAGTGASDQHHVRFDMPVVALDKRGLDQLQTVEFDQVQPVTPQNGKQVAHVERIFQHQFHAVFGEPPGKFQEFRVWYGAVRIRIARCIVGNLPCDETRRKVGVAGAESGAEEGGG